MSRCALLLLICSLATGCPSDDDPEPVAGTTSGEEPEDPTLDLGDCSTDDECAEGERCLDGTCALGCGAGVCCPEAQGFLCTPEGSCEWAGGCTPGTAGCACGDRCTPGSLECISGLSCGSDGLCFSEGGGTDGSTTGGTDGETDTD